MAFDEKTLVEDYIFMRTIPFVVEVLAYD